ncbi:hypothetical protein [Microvirga massiliensis]|uniref:hypothetical protein n=1 Tax=Microvirga massiliensis TaxID=1033741 RepID=UPI00062B99EF|nr:hypothetical protein [Microvirga massiliensis]
MPFISAAEAATLTALNLHRRSEQDGRALNRVRVSDKTLREITGRRRLDGRFFEDFAEELLELGWVIIRTHSAWGFLRASAVMGWPRINTSRISDELDQIAGGNLHSVIRGAQAELDTQREPEADSNPEALHAVPRELAAV